MPDIQEDTITRHVREMLNELHHKIGYRTALIQEVSDMVRQKLRDENKPKAEAGWGPCEGCGH